MRADVHVPNPDPRSSVHKPSYPRERALTAHQSKCKQHQEPLSSAANWSPKEPLRAHQEQELISPSIPTSAYGSISHPQPRRMQPVTVTKCTFSEV